MTVKSGKLKTEDDLVFIEFRWAESRVDTLAYKPYSPGLDPQDVWLRVAVPNIPKYIVSVTKMRTVLTLEGWGYVQSQMGKVFQSINPNSK